MPATPLDGRALHGADLDADVWYNARRRDVLDGGRSIQSSESLYVGALTVQSD